MKDILIYGGAFNPPTIAHQTVAQAAADYAEKHEMELWILPSGKRADKQIDVDVDTRLSLVRALLASLTTSTTVRICDIELKNDTLTQTIDTHRKLEKMYPQSRFMWLFGSDSVNTMHQWNEGDWLLSNLGMLIVQRPGFEIDIPLGDNAHFLDVEQIDISSTEVRERRFAGLPIEHLVPPLVLPFV